MPVKESHRLRIFCCATDSRNLVKGSPKTYLESTIGMERLPTEELNDVFYLRSSFRTDIREFMDDLATDGIDPILPRYDRKPTANGNKKFFIVGTSVFRDEKLIQMVDTERSRYLMWIRNKSPLSRITLPIEGGSVTTMLRHNSAQIVPELAGNRVSFVVDVQLSGEIENIQTKVDVTNPEVVERLEERIAQEIEKRIHTTLVALNSKQIDAVGLAAHFAGNTHESGMDDINETGTRNWVKFLLMYK